MWASSAGVTRGCRSGVSYISHHAISQRNPSAPVMTNAQYQPYRTVIHGTTIGVTIAPTLVPELKMPVASARSFFGNHSATLLIAGGKVAALAKPERETRRHEAGHRRRRDEPDGRKAGWRPRAQTSWLPRTPPPPGSTR